jgi:Tfp pilus assembly protein PilX
MMAIRNDHGSVLVIGLLTLALLSLLGSAATTTSRTEIQIAGNDKSYKEALYTAEVALTAGEMVVEQLLQRVDLDEDTIAGRYGEDDPDQPAWNDPDAWSDDYSVMIAADDLPAGLAALDTTARYMVAQRSFTRDSLTMGIGAPTGLYTFTVSGHGSASKNTAETVLQTIYSKRYD